MAVFFITPSVGCADSSPKGGAKEVLLIQL